MSEPTTPSATPQTTANLPVFSPAGGENKIQTSLSLSSHIDSSDLVAVAVSEAEQQIRQRLNAARRIHADAKRKLTALTGENAVILSDWTKAQADADARLTVLSNAVLPFWNTAPTRTYADATYSKQSGNFTGAVTLSTNDFRFSLTYSATAPTAYISNLTLITDATKAVEEAARNVLACQSSLNNLDSVERSARAALGSAMAEKVEGGTELINKIRASVNVSTLIDDNTDPSTR